MILGIHKKVFTVNTGVRRFVFWFLWNMSKKMFIQCFLVFSFKFALITFNYFLTFGCFVLLWEVWEFAGILSPHFLQSMPLWVFLLDSNFDCPTNTLWHSSHLCSSKSCWHLLKCFCILFFFKCFPTFATWNDPSFHLDYFKLTMNVSLMCTVSKQQASWPGRHTCQWQCNCPSVLPRSDILGIDWNKAQV